LEEELKDSAILKIFLVSFQRSKRDGESSMEILKKRYARGEITREQFEEMKNHNNKSMTCRLSIVGRFFINDIPGCKRS